MEKCVLKLKNLKYNKNCDILISMTKCGIYKIENVVNNKYYIGSSKNIDKRWTAHKRAKDKSSYLHHAIKKHGIADFHFEMLEECGEEELLKIEQEYLDIAFLMPNMIYNTNRLAAAPPNWKGKKRSAENIANIVKSKTGKKQPNISAAKIGKKQPNISAALNNPEVKAKISAAWKGKKRPPFSMEHRVRLSISHKGHIPSNRSLVIYSFKNVNGEVFTGTPYDFYSKYNLHQGHINALVKGKHKSVKGWILI